jgi:hypothetical protein
MSALKRKSRVKRQTWTKKQEEDWNFNIVELPLQVSIYCTVSEESKRRQRSFKFIKIYFSRDNAWFHVSVMAMLHGFMRCHDYLTALEGFQQSPDNHNNFGRLIWNCEDCQNNWTSYQDEKNWRSYHGFQNKDDRWIWRWLSIGKP